MEDSTAFRIVLFGDIFMGGDFLPNCFRNNYSPFGNISALIQPDDVVFANVETSFFQGYQRPYRTPLLWSPPESVQFLKNLKLDVAGLANNHIMDYGTKAMWRTKNLLENNGFSTFGAGLNLKNSLIPAIIEKNGIKTGFLGFTSNAYNVRAVTSGSLMPGCPPMKLSLMVREIKKLKQLCNIVCVSLHWGHEYTNVPLQDQRTLATSLINAGADVIIGTHPHMVQGYEIINGKPVFYSLGNFFFPEFETKTGFKHTWKPGCEYSLMAMVCFKNGRIEVEVEPLKSSSDKVSVLENDEKISFISKLKEYNKAILEGSGNKLYLETLLKIKQKRTSYLKQKPKQIFKSLLEIFPLIIGFKFVEGLRLKFGKSFENK